MDLTKRKVKINEHLEITLGRFLFSLTITIIQVLGIMCSLGWTLVPAVFFSFATMLLSLQKQGKEDKILELEYKNLELEKRILELEEKINGNN